MSALICFSKGYLNHHLWLLAPLAVLYFYVLRIGIDVPFIIRWPGEIIHC